MSEFVPMDKTTSNSDIYKLGVTNWVYVLNLVTIMIVILSSVGNIAGYVVFAVFLYVILSFWILVPSGVRMMYNKTGGNVHAGDVAFMLCLWLGVIGWLICYLKK
jgi:hypothetical protein